MINVTNVIKSTSKIAKITKKGREDVYDFTVRDVHRINANGFYTSNCHHPEISTFINIKRNKLKVTGANVSVRVTDEFMNAVKEGKKYVQRFPVDKNQPSIIEHEVDAREVWKEITSATRDCSEPGILFWDTVKRRSPADAYATVGFETVSTNPCITGDTLIAVADGRGYVPIKQLADEGRDVPVYAIDDAGKMVVRKMRNPRLTGKNMPVFKVTIEGGHSFKATGNHQMIMRDGTQKRVDELYEGDQLMISKRVERTLVEMGSRIRPTNPNHYVMIENNKCSQSEHRMIWKFHNGDVPKGYVIHHVNFDSKDNRLENLQCLDYFEHRELHAAPMRGINNPIFKIKADPKRFAEYSAKMSESVKGNNNPRAYVNVSNNDIRQHVVSLTKKLGRRVSINEWYSYAKALRLPMRFTGSQHHELGNFYSLSLSVADELGLKHAVLDTRIQRNMVNAIEQGYDVDIINDEVFVNRTCEWCHDEFANPLCYREIAFCSLSCSNLYANRKQGKNEARKVSLQAMHASKAELSRKAILDVFTELRFKLNRDPLQDELRNLCKQRKLSYRTGTKNGFKNWSDIKQCAMLHNHRVVSVEPCGNEDVYNGTVDEFHNFCLGGWEIENNERLQLHTKNCGEITLSAYDSCRLLLINLTKFVKNPFTTNATFDYDSYAIVVQKAQRLMDDLIDLEIEAIDKIIHKIEQDPEPQDVKDVEIKLWKKIRDVAISGRRTGLGITALGDTFAYLGMKYGSDESIELTGEIYKNLALNSYRSSVELAKERGAFPAFSLEIEKNHPFIKQVVDLDNELKSMYEKYGRRNIANTTTAPAGSVSLLTQTTSGCEPVIFIKSTRKKKINPSDKQARVDEIDKSGDSWQHYDVFHPGVKMWMNITGRTNVLESPYAGSTVEEIDWMKKIDIQAAAQKWICHAISNCVVGRSLVETSNGLQYIDELIDVSTTKQGEYVNIACDVVNHEMNYVSASHFYDNGIKQTQKITLKNGLALTATENERVMVLQDDGSCNWKYFKDVKPGDRVSLRSSERYIY
jgi:ribonucleotide reductase alpha subunit